VVKPAARREVVAFWNSQGLLSERRGCRLLAIGRSTVRYLARPRSDGVLRQRLKLLAEQYPRYGYPTLHVMLRSEGAVLNHKRTYRVYCEEKLQVRTKRRKKLTRPRIPMAIPGRVNERWSIDFVSDQLADGRRFRILNIVDDFSRECVGQIVDSSISGARLARYFQEISSYRPLPRGVVCDNGPELTSKAMFFWSQQSGVKLHFIQPGKPTQNAFVESFNGKFRDHCLNQHWFRNLGEARKVIEAWRRHYNNERPHSALGYLAPAVFAEQAA
jgi:putative transposase